MPGAKVWDPTPAGGSLSTARGEQNPSADGASLSSTEVALTRALVSGAGISVASSREITSADSGALLRPNAGVTLTIPAGLSPMPSFTVDCPASGTISVAVSGGATMNGASTTLTRTRAANPVGFVVLAHESDAYGVSGG